METSINAIVTDINELVSIASIGEPRLDEFDTQLFELESALSTTEMGRHDDYYERCRRLQGSLAATKISITDWTSKTQKFLHDVHCFAKDRNIMARFSQEMSNVELKITTLLKTFAIHIQRIQQQEEKLVCIQNVIEQKKHKAKSTFERGKTPLLGVTHSEILI